MSTSVAICIGQSLISILAEEGSWQSEDGRCIVAADDLYKNDPYIEINRIRSEKAEANNNWRLAYNSLHNEVTHLRAQVVYQEAEIKGLKSDLAKLRNKDK